MQLSWDQYMFQANPPPKLVSKRKQKKELDEEARRFTRKVKNASKRVEEEEVIIENMLYKKEEDARRKQQGSQDKEDLMRAERNRNWREEKQLEKQKAEWLLKEDQIIKVIGCLTCGDVAIPSSLMYQCSEGHIVCGLCADKEKVTGDLLGSLKEIISPSHYPPTP